MNGGSRCIWYQAWGGFTFKKLVGYFGHPRDVMQATAGQLTRVAGYRPEDRPGHYRISGRQNSGAGGTRAPKPRMSNRHTGRRRLSSLLKTIDDPPPVLYVKGN